MGMRSQIPRRADFRSRSSGRQRKSRLPARVLGEVGQYEYVVLLRALTSFHGSSCANIGKDALNTEHVV
eukprot:8642281-Pyramimonas_sp.AAC.1